MANVPMPTDMNEEWLRYTQAPELVSGGPAIPTNFPGATRKKSSLLQRLLASVPTMIRGGIDAASTPNIAFGGPTDMFRAAQAAMDNPIDRAAKQAQLANGQQDSYLQWLQYQRQVDAQNEQKRQWEAKFKYDQDHDKQTIANSRAQAISQAHSMGAVGVQPDMNIDPSRVVDIDGFKVYYPTPEEKASQPPTGADFRSALNVAGTMMIPKSRTITFPNSQVPEFTQPQPDQYGPPEGSDSKIRNLSLLSPMVRRSIARPMTVDNPTPEGYSNIPGFERGGERMVRATPETLNASKPVTSIQQAIARVLTSPNPDQVVLNSLLDANQQIKQGAAQSIEQALVKAYQAGDQESVTALMELKRHFSEASTRPGAPKPQLSQAALVMLGKLMADTGTMPALGNNADLRAQVANAAADVTGGGNVDLAKNQAQFRSNQSALNAVRRQRNQLEPFANTALITLDRSDQQIKQLADVGSPLFNTPFREFGKTVQGSAAMARFNAQRLAVYNEVARILSNPNATGVLSDTARKEAEGILNDGYTPNQWLAATDEVRKEISSRIQLLKQQEDDLVALMGRGGGDRQPTGGDGGGNGAPEVKEQYSPSTGQYRYSLDGGKTWQTGRAPRQ